VDDSVPFDAVPFVAVAAHETLEATGCVVPGPVKALASARTEILSLSVFANPDGWE
jgi:hypothetical protein